MTPTEKLVADASIFTMANDALHLERMVEAIQAKQPMTRVQALETVVKYLSESHGKSE